jgi:glycerol-3-phosphate acyltransferase PlsY
MPLITIGIIISYLIGAIPTAYIFGRVLKGIDIRKHGSGNVGATNALRVLGKKAGITVLILDVLKGIFAILLAEAFVARVSLDPLLLRLLFGLSCISGHNWTIFLRFKGGKGMATTLGVLIGLAVKTPGLGLILIMLILSWLLIFLLFRIVSLASVCAAIALPVYMLVFRQPPAIIITAFVLSGFVILRHKPNLIRLLQGKETRLKF